MSDIRAKLDVDEVEHWLNQIQALLTPEQYRRVAPLMQKDRRVMARVRQQGAAPEHGAVDRHDLNGGTGP